MIVFYTVHRCPHCNRYIDVHFFVGTALGPPTFECRKCGKPFASRRLEWTHFGTLLRLWYGVVSLIYATVVGFLLLMTTAVAYNAFGATDAVTNQHSKAALFVGAAAVLALQALRVLASKRRAAAKDLPPFKPGFFGCAVNLQLQILLAWFVVFAAGLAAGLLRAPPPAS